MLATSARAQTACVFDTAAHRAMKTYTLSVRVTEGIDARPNAALSGSFATVLRARWHPPQTLARMFYPYTVPSDSLLQASRYDDSITGIRESNKWGRFAIEFGTDGKVHRSKVLVTLGDSASDSSFLAAFSAPDSDDIVNDLASQVIGMRLGGSVVATVYRQAIEGSAPVLRLTVPVLLMDRAPEIRSAPRIHMPDGYYGLGETVMMSFVIDEDGRADPGSIFATGPADRLILADARKAVLLETFNPAAISSCPVKQRVQQMIRYGTG